MRKIYLLFAFVLSISWQAKAQFGCDSAITLTDGYTASNITTPGDGGEEDWNDNPSSSCGANAAYWDDDVYLYEYTAGASSEEISMTIDSRNTWNGVGVFTTCNGTDLDDCIASAVSTTSGMRTVTTMINAGQTVYIAIGQWGTPNDLDFDVISFSASSCLQPSDLTTANITTTSADLGWTENGMATTWNIEWGAEGFTQGMGTMVTGTSTNPHNLMGLTQDTDYEFYVQADCGGEVSAWVGPLAFSTLVSCAAPSDLTATNITTVSADLGWTENGTAPAWIIEWGEAGFTQGTGMTVGTGTNPHNLMGLTQDTAYEFYVQSACPGETSNWIGPFEFSTLETCPDPSALTATNLTDTSADLGWTENGMATTWNIEWGEDGFTQGMGTTITDTTTNPHNISGLTAETDYDFYVQANCGNGDLSDWIGPFSFTTNIETAFTCGDDFIDEGGTDANYNSDSNITYTFTPDMAGEVVSLNFSTFILEGDGADDCYDQILIYNGPDTSSPLITPADLGGTGTHTGFCYDSATVGTFNLAGQTVTSSHSSGALTVVFESDGSVTRAGWEATVTCAPPPTCPAPTGLNAMNVSGSSADLGWTENGTATTWNIEWGEAGFTQGMGTMVNGTTTNPHNLSGLNELTEYEFYVQANCGGDTSDWTGPISFTTGCAAITNYPYDADFDLIPADQCWYEADSGTVATGPEDAGAGTWFANQFTKNGVVLQANTVNLWQAVRQDWIVGPEFDLSTGGPYELNLTVWHGGNTLMTVTEPFGSDDKVELVRSTDSGATWTVVTTWDNNNDPGIDGAELNFDLTGESGTVIYALRADEGSTDDTEDTYFSITRFQIREIPSCGDVSGISISNVGSDTAQIDWTASSSAETAWEYVVQEAGTGVPTTNGDMASSTTVMADMLNATTDYEVYVRSDCGGGMYGAWIGPVNFTTECGAITDYPYNADFDLIPADECWYEADSGTVATGPEDAGAGLWYANQFTKNGEVLQANTINLWQATRQDWIVGPEFDLSTGGPYELNLTVWHGGIPGMTVTEPFGSDDKVELVRSTDSGATWTVVTTWDNNNDPGIEGAELNFDLTGESGTVIYALRADEGSTDDTEDTYFSITKFEIREIPNCGDVSGITVSNIGTDSAQIDWTASSSAETAWEYVVQEEGTGVPTTNGEMASSTTAMADMLTEATSYEVYVRSDCGNDTYGAWIGPVVFETIPANDDCSDAMELTVGEMFSDNAVDGTVAGASADGEPDADCGLTGPGVWYTLTVPNLESGATLSIEVGADTATNTDSFDSVIEVFSGDCGTLTSIACDDDGATTGSFSLVELTEGTDISAGDVLYIRVWGYDGDEFDPFSVSAHSTGLLSTNESSLAKNNIQLFPNPTSNVLNIKTEKEIKNIAIFTANGKKVMDSITSSKVDVSNLTLGVYFVQITTEDGLVQNSRFIKK